jgi:hypothetical protein
MASDLTSKELVAARLGGTGAFSLERGGDILSQSEGALFQGDHRRTARGRGTVLKPS